MGKFLWAGHHAFAMIQQKTNCTQMAAASTVNFRSVVFIELDTQAPLMPNHVLGLSKTWMGWSNKDVGPTSCLRKGFSFFSSSENSSPSSHSFIPVCTTQLFRVARAAARITV